MATPATVDAYLAALPPTQRAVMDELRRIIVAAAPGATETIAYQMPAIRLDGRFLVSYAAFKRHYSLFPASDAVVTGIGRALRPYLAGKGTIRFPAGDPIPTAMVARIVGIRMDEQAGRSDRRVGGR